MLANAIPTLANAILPNAPDPVITPSVIGFTIGSAILVAVMSAVPAVWRLKRLVIADALAGR
jgi:ABC-type antimicrobial peptide transport system permease subunit